MKIDGKKFQERVADIVRYNKVRGWDKTKPEDLAKSIVLESAELLEHYQWDASARRLKRKKIKDQTEIMHEVADIFWYLILFCKEAKIDMVEAMEKKMKYNEEKYPEAMFKGHHNHEFYQSQKKKYRTNKKKN